MLEKLISKLFANMCASGDAKKNEGLTTPADIERFDDIAYGDDPNWHMLDVYRPKGISGKFPTIVSVHGGGWVYGSKEVYQYYCMSLAQQGFAVVNFSYPLAPAATFPSVLLSTAQAFAWVADHVDDYGFDLGNLFAVGDSAGAHTLAQYCCAKTNPAYAEALGLSCQGGPLPKAVALNCGVYDLSGEYQMGFILDSVIKTYCTTDHLAERRELMSVARYVREGFPKTFLMTCPGDFLYAQRLCMQQALEAAGVDYELHVYGDESNKLTHVFHCDLRLPEAALCNREECDFFKGFID